MKHTSGPLEILRNATLAGYDLDVITPGGMVVASVYSEGVDPEQVQADAELFAAAPDLALLVRALWADEARIAPLNRSPGFPRGLVVFNEDFALDTDPSGLPVLTDAAREALRRVVGEE